MPEIRKNLITGEFVILAPERSARPQQALDPRPPRAARPQRRDDCPFCPGNERATPPSTWRAPPEGPGWRVRAFPNKFSVLSVEGEIWHRAEDLHVASAGVGPHEVICETDRHDLTLAQLSGAEVAEVVRAWHARFRAFHADPRVAYVSLFKNHGPTAGTSIEHSHSQIVGLPMVPVQARRRVSDAEGYREITGACLFCRTLEDELAARERLVLATPRFVSFIPWAALSPYHLWIFPRRHAGSFAAADAAELEELGSHLNALLRLVERALDDADYNLVVQSGPPEQGASRHLHWYVSVVPRVNRRAGFELGTAMYINTSPPEESAALLRAAGEAPGERRST